MSARNNAGQRVSADRKERAEKWHRLYNRKNVFIAVFLLPGIVMFAVIYAYPLVTIFTTSFCDWNYTNLTNPEFLGIGRLFDNYIQLFTKDYYFMKSLTNSLKWVGLSVVIQAPLAVLVALALSKKPRGWQLTRNVYIIPNIISTAAIGVIFFNMYNPNYGAVTEVLRIMMPDKEINILAGANTAFWGVTFSFIFYGGTLMILVLAQIFSISPDLYEAARIDGAKGWQIDRHITLPLLKPILGTITILTTNYSLLLYNEIALITGGKPDNATYSLSYFIFQKALGSSKLNFALANSAGVIQFILGIVLIDVINRLFKTDRSEL